MDFFRFLRKKSPAPHIVQGAKPYVAKPLPDYGQGTPSPESPGGPHTGNLSVSRRPSPGPADISRKADGLSTLDLSPEEADLDPELVNVYNRQHQRINRGQILDEEIKAYCRNITSGKTFTALVIDLSPGGMLLLTNIPLQVDDELLIKCRIGTNFKMNERVVVRRTKGRKNGVQFLSLSQESKTFLIQLYGAINLREY